MKSAKLKVSALVLTMALVMGGCGEKPYTLTEQEESIIVNYAAHVVSKYNQRQSDGLSYVAPETETKDTEEQTETERKTERKTEDTPETSTKAPSEASTEKTTASEPEQTSTQTKSEASQILTKALGLEGLTAEYKSAELKDSYEQTGYFSLEASNDDTFLIVHITLENPTDKAIACDMLSKKLTFVATMNGDLSATAKTTLLLNDLGTYKDTIAAGASVDTVLLFEVPAAELTSVSQLGLQVQNGDESDELGL